MGWPQSRSGWGREQKCVCLFQKSKSGRLVSSPLVVSGINNFDKSYVPFKSRGSSVSIALGYRLDDRGSRVRFPTGAWNFSLHHRVQNGSGAHPASYPMSTRSSFPGDKAAGAWSWPLTSIYCRGKECVELNLHAPIRLHIALLSWEKHGENFTVLPFTGAGYVVTGSYLSKEAVVARKFFKQLTNSSWEAVA
jgi:hypothetical protein